MQSKNSKKSKKNKQASSNKKNGDGDSPTTGPFYIELKNGKYEISCFVKPNAKTSDITDIVESEYIGISLAAPPRDGEANQELVNFIKSVLAVRKSDLDFAKGGKSRYKMITVDQSCFKSVQDIHQ